MEAKQANLRETLLRISGAMQVLQEQLSISGLPVSGKDGAVDTARKAGDARQETSEPDAAIAG